MKRQVLIEGYRPGGLSVFISRPAGRGKGGDPVSGEPRASRPKQASSPAPRPPSGGSAVSIPKKS